MSFFPATAVILAGGAGTRLQAVVNDVPKPMAPVGNFPFLHYQFLFLKKQGIKKVILSVGYLAEVIKSYFGQNYSGIEIDYCIEATPLGTGGGIKLALEKCGEDCFILNGDTFFDVDLKALAAIHNTKNSDLSIALSHQKNFDRFGTVTFDENHRIISFREKRFCSQGWINGGVYCCSNSLFEKVKLFTSDDLSEKFSFEKTVLEEGVKHLRLFAGLFQSYFIDIGIPDDYEKAKSELPEMFWNAASEP